MPEYVRCLFLCGNLPYTKTALLGSLSSANVDMKTVYLVRHGESSTNVGGPILGAETPLTNNGRAQAVTVAERCTRIPIDVIISSTHVRARETAEAVSAKVSKPIRSEEHTSEL